MKTRKVDPRRVVDVARTVYPKVLTKDFTVIYLEHSEYMGGAARRGSGREEGKEQ